jgi:glycosyltransferase involved in cell wall biosynthesis
MTLLGVYVISAMLLESTFIEASQGRDAYYVIRTKLESLSGLHPTYFSLLNALAFLALLDDLQLRRFKSITKVFSYLALAIILAALLIASSKMILFACFLSSLLLLAKGLSRRAVAMRLTLMIALGFITVFSLRPLKERAFTLLAALQETKVEEHNPDSMRKAIYQATWQTIADQPLFGTGIGDAQTALNEKYEENGYSLAKERGFNTHNQYLHLWLSVGILPFLLFIASIVVQFLIAMVMKNRLHSAYVVLVSLSFLSENLLARQDGVFVYAFFSSVFCYASWSKNGQRVFINGRYLSQALTGVQRFASELATSLLRSADSTKLITMRGLDAVTGNRQSLPTLKGSGQIWEQVVLPLYLKLSGSPLLINLGNSAPVLYSNSIVCLHDVAFRHQPNWFSNTFVRWYNYMIPRVLNTAQHVITVSDFSKQEIMHYYQIPTNKISVLYNGKPSFTEHEFRLSEASLGDYALCVGSLSERKNQKYLIEAYLKIDKPDFKLVLAGTLNQDLFHAQADLLQRIKANNKVILKEAPTDKELSNLYAQAKFCVYVPHYEGFGIPVLEAFAYKKPILVSDIPVFRELFSSTVLFSSLTNIDNLREKLEEMNMTTKFWGDKVAAFDFKQRGFSYEISAKKLLSLIEDTRNAKDY